MTEGNEKQDPKTSQENDVFGLYERPEAKARFIIALGLLIGIIIGAWLRYSRGIYEFYYYYRTASVVMLLAMPLMLYYIYIRNKHYEKKVDSENNTYYYYERVGNKSKIDLFCFTRLAFLGIVSFCVAISTFGLFVSR